MRIKFSVKFLVFYFSAVSLFFFFFDETAYVFKEELILSHIVLETKKESTVVRSKMNYTQGIIGARVEPRTS